MEIRFRQSQMADRSPANTFASLLSPQTYKVAAVTFANGGDNIGIYVPSSDLTSLGVILSVFFLLIGVCYVAYQLTASLLSRMF